MRGTCHWLYLVAISADRALTNLGRRHGFAPWCLAVIFPLPLPHMLFSYRGGFCGPGWSWFCPRRTSRACFFWSRAPLAGLDGRLPADADADEIVALRLPADKAPWPGVMPSPRPSGPTACHSAFWFTLAAVSGISPDLCLVAIAVSHASPQDLAGLECFPLVSDWHGLLNVFSKRFVPLVIGLLRERPDWFESPLICSLLLGVGASCWAVPGQRMEPPAASSSAACRKLLNLTLSP